MSNTKITFTDRDIGLNNFRFVLEPAENAGKTIFAPNERARLKLYPGSMKPRISTTNGTAKIYLTGLTQTYTEYLVFRDSDEAKATYYIKRLISAVWEGTGAGSPKIYGNRLVLPSKTSGVMKLRYETSYDLVDIISSNPTYILVTAKGSGLEGDFLVDFTDGYLTDTYEKDVVMTVRDACTKYILPDANVYINDRYTGKTDSSGIIRLGSMKKRELQPQNN